MLPEIRIHTTEDNIKYALYDQPEVISDQIRRFGAWNPGCLEISEKILEKKAGGKVLDIGSGFGPYTIPLARKFQEKFTYVAFEPLKPIYKQLTTNLVLNGLDSLVETKCVVLSTKEEIVEAPILDVVHTNNHGSYSFNEEINKLRGMVSHSKTEKYEFKTLDSYNFNNVALIKITTPGMVFDVIDGARNTIINNNFPPVIFEAWTEEWYAEYRAKIMDFFASHAYEHYLNLGEHMVAFKTMSQYNHYMLEEKDVETLRSFQVTEQQHDTESVLQSQQGIAP
jgi:FkbM family methyltransferase